jgi:secondary thiamine-phosphate synthase enzyme
MVWTHEMANVQFSYRHRSPDEHDHRQSIDRQGLMKNHTIVQETVRTKDRSQMLDITDRVAQAAAAAGIIEGLAIIFVPHTTAAVTINENADPDVKHDMLRKLSELIPKQESYYRHGEGNSDSHVKTSLVGNSVMVLIEKGKPVLGTWQGIYFCEFDGPRTRDVIIKLVSF